jgi:hypothetical protein
MIWPILFVLGVFAVPVSAEKLILADGGKTAFRIVVSDSASPSTKHAAEELQRFLRQISGAELPIVSDSTPMGGHEIILGRNAHLRQLGVQIDFDKLGPEGYVLRVSRGHLIIAGGSLRGNLYGVYGLLDEHFGCRWFTTEVSRIPKRSRLAVGPLDETKIPVFEDRDIFIYDCLDGDWRARNRVTGHRNRLKEKHGGKTDWHHYDYYVHTFAKFLPYEKYYDEHPEYFMEIEGTRPKKLKQEGQPCFTHPDVIRLVTEEVLRIMRETPTGTVISVSQNDNPLYCRCERCDALARQEGAQMAPLLQLVNKVAEAVERDFPERSVETLAYMWSVKPPKTIRPRDNVIIRLCSYGASSNARLEETYFAKSLKAWAKVTDRIWFWTYPLSMTEYYIPWPIERVIEENVRFFADNNVTGVFFQDNSRSPHGNFNELDGYLMARLLWDPDYGTDRAMNEFLEAVYGKAAPPIRTYIDLLHDKADAVKAWLWPGTPTPPYLTPEVLGKSVALWDEAEAAVAEDPDVHERVLRARLSIDYAVIMRAHLAMAASRRFRVVGDTYVADAIAYAPDVQRTIDRFLTVGERAKIIQFNEKDTSLKEFRAQLQPKGRQYKTVSIENDSLAMTFVPDLTGRMVELKLKPTGRNVCHPGVPEQKGYPDVAGYSESADYQIRGVGPYETQIAASADGTVLTARRGSQDPLTRKIILPTTGSTFRIETTCPDSKVDDRPVGLRGQFVFDLGRTDDVTLALPGRPGVSLSMPAGECERTEVLSAQDVAAGLTLANHALDTGVRIDGFSETLDLIQVHVNARRRSIAVRLQARPGATRLDHQVTLLTDVGHIPVAQHVPAEKHRAGRIRFGQDDMRRLRPQWGGFVKDPTASSGYAIHLLPDHKEWALQSWIDPSRFEPETPYDVYAHIRVEKKGTHGEGFSAGIYDQERGALGGYTVKLQDIKDNGWHIYKLGRVTPSREQFIWCAPRNNPQDVGGIWVDYFEMRAVRLPR